MPAGYYYLAPSYTAHCPGTVQRSEGGLRNLSEGKSTDDIEHKDMEGTFSSGWSMSKGMLDQALSNLF